VVADLLAEVAVAARARVGSPVGVEVVTEADRLLRLALDTCHELLPVPALVQVHHDTVHAVEVSHQIG